jgi:hypothetical protein
MIYKVKLSVHFPLDPVSRSAVGKSLFQRERDIEDMVSPHVSVKYVDTYMLRSSDCYGYEGATVFDGNRLSDHATSKYDCIKMAIEAKYPQAIVSVVFSPTAPTFSFGPTQLPELPRIDL